MPDVGVKAKEEVLKAMDTAEFELPNPTSGPKDGGSWAQVSSFVHPEGERGSAIERWMDCKAGPSMRVVSGREVGLFDRLAREESSREGGNWAQDLIWPCFISSHRCSM